MTEAQAAALSWLKIADKDDAKGTYDASAQRFHAAMTQEQWAQALAHARNQFGPVKRRTLLGARPPAPAKDVPPGDFAVIVYRTEFEKRPTGTETLTLERESDGKWRVVGYLMR